MTGILVLAIICMLLGVIFLLVLQRQTRQFGVLTGEKIYQDTIEHPGEILSASHIRLSGKPDYIIQTGSNIIPVEVKTGKTPHTPYINHIMQLMAYCYLIEENFGVRPQGGYIRYPEKEFPVAYTDEAKESIENIVQEIIRCKISGEEFHCNHPVHYM